MVLRLHLDAREGLANCDLAMGAVRCRELPLFAVRDNNEPLPVLWDAEIDGIEEAPRYGVSQVAHLRAVTRSNCGFDRAFL